MSLYIEVDGNWKTFLHAKSEDMLFMLHATSLENAKRIMLEGFKTNQKNWEDSEEGFVYLSGSEYGLGTYMKFRENAIVKVAVRKKDLLADSNSGDWKGFIHNPINFSELKREGINPKNPTAFETFKYIGQVKAKLEDVKPIGWYRK